MVSIRALLAAALLAGVCGAAHAAEATVLWSQDGCEFALVQKPDKEYGVIYRMSEGRVQEGDKLEGDFESINQIRKMKNLDSGEEIMMRGVRYSTSKKNVLQIMPRWCKIPKE
jgi:hypothetical protein